MNRAASGIAVAPLDGGNKFATDGDAAPVGIDELAAGLLTASTLSPAPAAVAPDWAAEAWLIFSGSAADVLVLKFASPL